MSKHHPQAAPSAGAAPAPPTSAPKAPVAAAPIAKAPKGKTVPEEVIRLQAYKKWETAGRPPGNGVQFWLEAERELLQAK
jgi:hypothetical protein